MITPENLNTEFDKNRRKYNKSIQGSGQGEEKIVVEAICLIKG